MFFVFCTLCQQKLVDLKAMNGNAFSFWHPSLADSASDLEHLSKICRQLHDEALKNSNKLWSLRTTTRSPSPPPTIIHNIAITTTERRSSSIEDLPSLVTLPVENNFTRDAKARRSLQVNDNSQIRKSRKGSIAERAKIFEELDRYEDQEVTRRLSEEDEKVFSPIRDNDFVKNDPRHPSKFEKTGSRYNGSERGKTNL